VKRRLIALILGAAVATGVAAGVAVAEQPAAAPTVVAGSTWAGAK
jgi:hypothetical protein